MTAVTAEAITALAGRAVMFHAAGLSDYRGRVVALVGASGQGKSTIARTLSASDFGYVTDEAVAVDKAGSVLPFPRPIALYTSQGVAKRKVLHGPDDLGLQACPEALTLARVVLLNRDPALSGPARVVRVPLLDALLALVPNCSALGTLDAPLQRLALLLSDVVGGAWRAEFRDAADLEGPLRDLLESEQSVEPWSPSEAATAYNPMAWALRDARVRRATHADAIESDEWALVLLQNRVYHVSGIGLTIWQAAVRALSLDQLAEHVVAVHGGHPEAGRLVGEAVDAMCRAGVLGYGVPQTLGGFLAAGGLPAPPRREDSCGVPPTISS